jgi:hypothetical protein
MSNDLRHKSKTYYQVRKVVRLVFWGALLAGVYYIATHLNWVGDGYCWGTMEKCYLGGK